MEEVSKLIRKMEDTVRQQGLRTRETIKNYEAQFLVGRLTKEVEAKEKPRLRGPPASRGWWRTWLGR